MLQTCLEGAAVGEGSEVIGLLQPFQQLLLIGVQGLALGRPPPADVPLQPGGAGERHRERVCLQGDVPVVCLAEHAQVEGSRDQMGDQGQEGQADDFRFSLPV